ncbi:MAG TPA: CDP-alcohol phosphatidyltransferase family protein, partial [Acidimicrobiales bacterium]|nr:CDP-alcohol phosphatidyltransferase family protein [Acidimicrobiales bacterium]
MRPARLSKRWGLITVPNALTLLRLACIPAFVALLAERHAAGRLAASCLLGGLGATDALDGYIARHFNQVSLAGKIADPIVDRLLVLSASIGVIAIAAAPAWLVVVILSREMLVLGAGGMLALAGAARIDVSWAGKAGSAGMMAALPLFIMGHAPFRLHHAAEALAWVTAAWGLAL